MGRGALSPSHYEGSELFRRNFFLKYDVNICRLLCIFDNYQELAREKLSVFMGYQKKFSLILRKPTGGPGGK